MPSVIENNKNFPGEDWWIGGEGREVSAEDLQKELVENYDVFLTWTVDDYFKENYSALFSDPVSIKDHSIYEVNKETGLLDFVGGE